MCTYTSTVKAKGLAEGKAEGEARTLIKMVGNLTERMPLHEALEMLKISHEEYEAAKKLVR